MAPPNDPREATDAANQQATEELTKQQQLEQQITAQKEAQAKLDAQMAANTQAKADAIEKIKQLEQEISNIKNEQQAQAFDTPEATAMKLKQKQEELEAAEKALEIEKETREVLKEQNEEIAKQAKETAKLQKEVEGAKKEQDDFLDGFKNLGGGIGKIFQGMSGIVDKIKKAQKFGQFLTKGAKAMKNIPGLSKLAGPIGSLGSAITRVSGALLALPAAILAVVVAVIYAIVKVAALTNEIDKLSKEISRQVGLQNGFQNSMFATYRSSIATGASLKDVQASLKGLAENVSAFNQDNEKLNSNLATTITKLNRVGVDATTSTKRIDFFNRALGMTLERSADVTVEIALMGQTIGKSTTQMMKDFEAFSKRFVLFGGTAMRTFKEMSALAKATGLEVSKLVSVSEKFDTFESAADHVAKLNSILGTNLSTLQMINMEDSKRIDVIRRQVKASVGQFSSLNKYQKLYIAQAMGIDDVAEAQRLLNMSTAEYNKYMRGQNEQSQKKNLDAFSKSLNTLVEELTIIGQQMLLAFEPMFHDMNIIIQEMAPRMQALGKILRLVLTPVVFNLMMIFKAFALTLQFFRPVVDIVNEGLDLLIGLLEDVFDKFHLSGSPMLYELPRYFAEGFKILGQALLNPIGLIGSLSSGMQNLFGSMHPTGMNFDIEAMANLDTSKIAAGFQQIKSALVDISSVQVDGFLALKTDGASTSMVMGSEGLIKNMTEGKLTVDVKMPEMKMPDVYVKVYIGDKELRDIIRQETNNNWVMI